MLSGMMNLVDRKKKVPTGNSLVQQAQKAAAKTQVEGLGLNPKKGTGRSLSDTLAKWGLGANEEGGMRKLGSTGQGPVAPGMARPGVRKSAGGLVTGPARPKGRSLAGVMKDLDRENRLDPDTRKLVRDSLMVRSGNNLGLEKWPFQGADSAEKLKVDNQTLLETLAAAKTPEGKAKLAADLQAAREARQAASRGMAIYNQSEFTRKVEESAKPGRDISGGKWGPTDKVFREQERQRAIREEKDTQAWKKKGGYAQGVYQRADQFEKAAGDLAKRLPTELFPPAQLLKMAGQGKLAKEVMGFAGNMGAGILTQIPRVTADTAVAFDESAPVKVQRDALTGMTLAVPDLVDEVLGGGLITAGAKGLVKGAKGFGKRFGKEALEEGLAGAAERAAARSARNEGITGQGPVAPGQVAEEALAGPVAPVQRPTVLEFAPGSAEPIRRNEGGGKRSAEEALAMPVARGGAPEAEALKKELFGEDWPEFTERLPEEGGRLNDGEGRTNEVSALPKDSALPGRTNDEGGMRAAEEALAMPVARESAGTGEAPVAPRERSEVDVMAPEDLKINPGIQYKTDLSDQANKVTSKFKDVTAYNVDQEGLLTVWQRLDGTREVAHGHHRAELAKRAKKFVRDVPGGGLEEVDRAVPVRVLKEEDGWTLPDVRRVAAVENLRNGDGSALDAVMVLKELGVKRDKLADYGVQIKGALGRNVDGLLRASEDVLSMVRKGEAPEEAAAGVAASGLPAEHQGRALSRAVSSGRIGYREAESFANDFRHFVVEDSTASLFGDELAVLDDAVEEGFRLKEAVRGDIIGRWDQLKKGLNLEPLDREVIDKAARSEELNRMGKKGEVAYKIDAVMDKFDDIVQLRGRLARQVKAGELTEADARNTLREAVLPELQLKQKAYIEGRRGNQSRSVQGDDGGVRPAGRDGEAGGEVRSVGRGSGETGPPRRVEAEKAEEVKGGSTEAGPSSVKGGGKNEVGGRTNEEGEALAMPVARETAGTGQGPVAPKVREQSMADMLEPEFELQAQKGEVRRKAEAGSPKADEDPNWNMRQEGLPGFGDKEGQFKLGEEPLFQGRKPGPKPKGGMKPAGEEAITYVTDRASFKEGLAKQFGYGILDDGTDVAETVTKIADARAKVQLRLAGKDASPEALDAWYKENFFAVTQKGAYMEDVVTPAQMQQGKGAYLPTADGRAIITAFDAADRTTAIHELGHAFRKKLEPALQTRATRHYVKEGTDWTREAEERFAQDLERYFRDGEAPTKGLVPVFEKIKEWFREVYKKLTGTGLEKALHPRVRGLFDEMFGGDFPLTRPFDPGEDFVGKGKSMAGPTFIKELDRTIPLTSAEIDRLNEIRRRYTLAEDKLFGLKEGAANQDEYRSAKEAYDLLKSRLQWELEKFSGDTMEGRRLADEESLRRLEMGEDPNFDRVEIEEGDGPAMAGAPGDLGKPLPADLAKRPEVKEVRDSHPTAPAYKEVKKAVFRRRREENNWRGMAAVAVGSAGDILRYADSKDSIGREAGERIFRDLEKILNVSAGRTVQAMDAVLEPVKKAYGKYWWDLNPKGKAELEDMAYKIHKASVEGKEMPEGLNENQAAIWKAWTKVNRFLALSGVETGAMVDRMVKGDIGRVLMGERVHFYDQNPHNGTLGELVGEVTGWADDALEVTVQGKKMWLPKYKPFSTKSLVNPEVFWPRRIKPEIMEAIKKGRGEEYDELIKDVALALDGQIPMTPDIKAQEEALDLLRSKVTQDQIKEAELAVKSTFRGADSAGLAVGYGARLEKQRIPFQFPDKYYDYSFGVAQNHIQEAIQRVTKAEIWGADGAKLVEQMKNMEAPTYYMDVVERVFGTGMAQTSGERTLKRVVSGIGNFMNLTLMTGLGTAVKQLNQGAAIAGVLGGKATLQGAVDSIADLGKLMLKKENGLDAIRKSGAVESDLMEMIAVDQANAWGSKATDVALTLTGVKPADKALRYLAANAGKIALYDNIGTNALGKQRLRVVDGKVVNNRHYRFLKEWVRLDDEAIKRLAETGIVTDQDKLMAYHAGARTQGRTRSGDMPTILTSQPVFRLLAQFQSFNVAQSKLLRYLWDEAVVNKNLVPLVRTVAAYAAVSWVNMELFRKLMAFVEDKEERPVPEDLVQRIAYNIAQSGMLGMLGRTSEAFVDPMALVRSQDDEDKNFAVDVAKKEFATLGAIKPPIYGLAEDLVGAVDHVAKGTDLSGLSGKVSSAVEKTVKGDLKGAGQDVVDGLADANYELFDRDLGVAAQKLARQRIVLLNRFSKRGEPDRNFALYEREKAKQYLKKAGMASEEDIRRVLDENYPVPTEPYAPPERVQWDLVYYGLMQNGALELSRAEARELTIEMLGKKPPMVGGLKEAKRKPLLKTGDFDREGWKQTLPTGKREQMERVKEMFQRTREKAGVK